MPIIQIQVAPNRGEALMQVIIEDRNQRVIDDLTEALQDKSNKRIAVIYGAGHMGDMTERMETQLGYEPGGTTWHLATSLDLARAGRSGAAQPLQTADPNGQLHLPANQRPQTLPHRSEHL